MSRPTAEQVAVREEIMRRCALLQYMGDACIMADYTDRDCKEAVEVYGWVLELPKEIFDE